MDAGLAELAVSGSPFPWLSLIVLLPAAAALVLPLVPSSEENPSPAPKIITLVVLLVDLLLMMGVLATRFDPSTEGLQLVERVSWLPALGLEWSLGVDGLSAPLVVLSGLVTFLSVAASWSVQRKSRLYFALMLVQASAQGLVFLSQDFLLFFLAWELELVPVYLLIAIWGGQNRQYAATKFILYTALASLLILISGLALALSGDTFTFNLTELASRSPGGSFGLLCYLGFLIGFGVNGVTGDYSRGASGFWIENGKLTYPVSGMTIAGNLKDMFKAITHANDIDMRKSTAAPSLRIDGMMVAGS